MTKQTYVSHTSLLCIQWAHTRPPQNPLLHLKHLWHVEKPTVFHYCFPKFIGMGPSTDF